MANSIFGSTDGLAGMLGDYNSIKNGTYGKLMKKYYGTTVSGSSSGDSTKTKGSSGILEKILEEKRNPKVSQEAEKANSTLTSSVGLLKNAVSTLQKADTFEDQKDTGGSTSSTGKEKTVSALKNFVASYNDALTASKRSTMTNVSSNIAGIMKATEANAEELKEIGITKNNDGTLNFNEKLLSDDELDKVKELFSGDDAMSYGSAVASRLNRVSIPDNNTSSNAAESAKQNAETSSTSTSLVSSLDSLMSDKLDIEGMLSETKNFIKFYNATLDSAGKTGISGVTSNLLAMRDKTAKHAGELSKLGITQGADGKLSMNENTFKSAGLSNIQDTFKKYGSDIRTNASLLNYYSTSGSTPQSSYSSNGAYTSANDIVSSLYNAKG